MIIDGEGKWYYIALKSESTDDLIVLQKVCLNYLEEQQQIIMEIFIV